MKKYQFTIGGNAYDVRVKSVQGSLAHVEVNGTSYEVHLSQEVKTTKTPILVRSAPVATPPKTITPASGLSKVTAPLPGIMIKIAVKDGDTVKVGDSLFILEAMKMENILRATKATTVKATPVAAGESLAVEQVIVEVV